MRYIKKTFILCLLIISVFISTSCSNLIDSIERLDLPTPVPNIGLEDYSEVLDKGPERGGVLKIASTKHQSLNPLFNDNYFMKDIFNLMFEGLVTIDENYKPKAVLCESFGSTSDSLVWTYNLKENIKWHDGKDFTANDVAFTIKTIMDNEDSLYHGLVKDIESYKVVNDRTITITYTTPNSFGASKMYFPIIPSHIYSEEINEESKGENVKPVGTGPYKFVSSNSNRMKLTANSDWHGGREPYITTVQVDFYRSVSDILNSDADIIFVKGDDMSKGLGKIGYGLKKFVNSEYMFFAMNHKRPLFSEVSARRIVANGLNKETNIKKVYSDTVISSDLPIFPENWLNPTNTTNYSYNKKNITEMLEYEGWTLANDRWYKSINNKRTYFEFECLVKEGDVKLVELANNFKKQLQKVNINMKVVEVKEADLINRVNSGNFDAAILGLNIISIGDLWNFYKTDNAGFNVSNYSSEKVDKLFEDLMSNNLESERKDIFTSIKENIIMDVPFVGLYFNQEAFFYNTRVKGITESKPIFINKLGGVQEWYIPGSSNNEKDDN